MEERHADPSGFFSIVERWPEDSDELDQKEQVPPAPPSPLLARFCHFCPQVSPDWFQRHAEAKCRSAGLHDDFRTSESGYVRNSGRLPNAPAISTDGESA